MVGGSKAPKRPPKLEKKTLQKTTQQKTTRQKRTRQKKTQATGQSQRTCRVKRPVRVRRQKTAGRRPLVLEGGHAEPRRGLRRTEWPLGVSRHRRCRNQLCRVQLAPAVPVRHHVLVAVLGAGRASLCARCCSRSRSRRALCPRAWLANCRVQAPTRGGSVLWLTLESRPMIDHYDSPFNDHELLITFVSSAVLKVL